MKYLIRQFGLTALGLCILAGAASLEMRLATIEAKLDRALQTEAALNRVAMDLPRVR